MVTESNRNNFIKVNVRFEQSKECGFVIYYSKPLREFCGFTKVPDASKITRFKQDFLADLQTVFDNLVDLTEPICQAIDSAKADMTIFDSSGIEAFVAENNPKYADRIIRQLKAYAKAMNFDKSYDPYKAAKEGQQELIRRYGEDALDNKGPKQSV